MSVYDRAELNWVDAEVRFIRDAVTHGLPYGAYALERRLLAMALEGDVKREKRPEVGVFPIVMSGSAKDDPYFDMPVMH